MVYRNEREMRKNNRQKRQNVASSEYSLYFYIKEFLRSFHFSRKMEVSPSGVGAAACKMGGAIGERECLRLSSLNTIQPVYDHTVRWMDEKNEKKTEKCLCEKT
ncbi:Protein CBG25920 [Caenorhabditis briggsae]|uniref:Protein CBG25920 n=1 Tax=Caenorhabditis briggsae TaxID=6238 RepID=B6IK52_CAEBR|nr:Protein CBG25920 [Caenorhabditis briggsae]CAS00282.1 Protein CBG25920 [Caenorhabditis briggsae]